MHKTPQPWKDKVQELFQVCTDELKRTTEIGKKMLSASKTNTNLHEAYDELGHLAAKALDSGTLQWDDPKAKELVAKIKECENDLEFIESELKKIKFASAPQDIGSSEGLYRELKKKKSNVREIRKRDHDPKN